MGLYIAGLFLIGTLSLFTIRLWLGMAPSETCPKDAASSTNTGTRIHHDNRNRIDTGSRGNPGVSALEKIR